MNECLMFGFSVFRGIRKGMTGILYQNESDWFRRQDFQDGAPCCQFIESYAEE